MWTPLVEWAARVRAVVTGKALDRDFDEELESHLTMLTEDNVRRGMPVRGGQARGASQARESRVDRRAPPRGSRAPYARSRAAGRPLCHARARTRPRLHHVRRPDRRAGHRRQRHRVQRRERDPASPAAVSPVRSPRLDREQRRGRRIRPYRAGVPFHRHPGSQSLVLRRRRIHGVLRRRRQQADRRGRAATAERRAGVAELLLRPWCDGAHRPDVHRGGMPLQRAEGGDARLCFLARQAQLRPDDRRPLAHAERRARDRRRRAALDVRLRIRVRAGHPHRAVLSVPALRGNQSLGQHDGDGRAPEGRRHAAAGAGRARRPGAADSPSRSRTELRAAPEPVERVRQRTGPRARWWSSPAPLSSACSSCAQTSPT